MSYPGYDSNVPGAGWWALVVVASLGLGIALIQCSRESCRDKCAPQPYETKGRDMICVCRDTDGRGYIPEGR